MDNDYNEYKSNGDRNRNLALDEHLNSTEPSLGEIITNHQNSDTWKTHLTIVTNFISSKDAKKEHVMHSRSDNIKFASYNDSNEVVA